MTYNMRWTACACSCLMHFTYSIPTAFILYVYIYNTIIIYCMNSKIENQRCNNRLIGGVNTTLKKLIYIISQ